MTQLLPYVIGGAVAVLALDLASSATRNLTSWPAVQQADAPVSNVARKGDRLRTNMTIVTKGLSLPVELPREQARDRKGPPPREKIKVGCEPSFSPVASPAMAHHTGRCVAGLDAPRRFAELMR